MLKTNWNVCCSEAELYILCIDHNSFAGALKEKQQKPQLSIAHGMFTPVIFIYILGKINKAHYGRLIASAASVLAQCKQ